MYPGIGQFLNTVHYRFATTTKCSNVVYAAVYIIFHAVPHVVKYYYHRGSPGLSAHLNKHSHTKHYDKQKEK